MNFDEKSLSVQTIYSSFMGEVNVHGIGAACTFVRFNGCNLRCYKDMGLCDTPEALKRSEPNMSINEVLHKIEEFGNKVVCLTGGEPLLQNKEVLQMLIGVLYYDHFCSVVIETNGTVPVKGFSNVKDLSLVVDYKTKSTGVKMPEEFFQYAEDLGCSDFVKFVLYDKDDFAEAKDVIKRLRSRYFRGNIAVGLYWGSKMTYKELRDEFLKDKSLGNIYINVQAHKMICLYDEWNEKGQVLQTLIPKDL